MKSSTRLALAATVVVLAATLYGFASYYKPDSFLLFAVENFVLFAMIALPTIWVLKFILGPMIDKKAETEDA